MKMITLANVHQLSHPLETNQLRSFPLSNVIVNDPNGYLYSC